MMRKRFKIFSEQYPLLVDYLIVSAIIISTTTVLLLYSLEPNVRVGNVEGGIFWELHPSIWIVYSIHIFIAIKTNGFRKIVAIISIGIITIGGIGLLEPFGVFHDSWRNVGLGQLVFRYEQMKLVKEVGYFYSMPLSFSLYGLLSNLFTNTSSFLRIYPIISLLLYTCGLYVLSYSFAEKHLVPFNNNSNYALNCILAFLILSSNFLVRINPAPQSLAFSLTPFLFASILKSKNNIKFTGLSILTFLILVLTHFVTSLTTLILFLFWFLLDFIKFRKSKTGRIIDNNKLILNGCIFFTWLIYLGVWIMQSGVSFFARFRDVLDSGQHASITVSSINNPIPWNFILIHRISLGGAFLLLVGGFLLAFWYDQKGGSRLIVWCIVAAGWLPALILGEFSDRGPLFVSLPASLLIGYIMSFHKNKLINIFIPLLLLVTSISSYLTSYYNHIGEVITQDEILAFESILKDYPDSLLIYGYVPPVEHENVFIYGRRLVRVYALGAADASLSDLVTYPGIIVISDQMRASAVMRGKYQLEALLGFENQLTEEGFEIIYDTGKVKAFLIP